jgi:hypothetical protein
LLILNDRFNKGGFLFVKKLTVPQLEKINKIVSSCGKVSEIVEAKK